jgi:hypothetical protein
MPTYYNINLRLRAHSAPLPPDNVKKIDISQRRSRPYSMPLG